MLLEECFVSQRVINNANKTHGTIEKINRELDLIKVSFDVELGSKTDTDGWWRPIYFSAESPISNK